MASGTNSGRGKRPSKSYNEQQNNAEFAEEHEAVKPAKMQERPPSLNQIPKKIME